MITYLIDIEIAHVYCFWNIKFKRKKQHMFDNRKKAMEEIAAREVARMERVAAEVKEKMESVGKMLDAGERYYVLTAAETQISKCRTEAEARLKEAVGNAGALGAPSLILIPFSMVAVVGTGGSAIAVGVLLSACAGLGGALKWENIGEKHQEEALSSFDSILGDMPEKIAAQRKDILVKELSAIVDSPYFDELFENVPEVKTAFAKAAERKAAKEAAKRSLAPPAPTRILKPKPLE